MLHKWCKPTFIEATIMALSLAEQGKLRDEYDFLSQLVIEQEEDQWAAKKEAIIALCTENDIPLYNMAALNVMKASGLLSRLLKLMAQYEKLEEANVVWDQEFLTWKQTFDIEVKKATLALVTLHDQAYLSIADQYQKRGEVSAQTLLTIKDMTDLLEDPDFISDDVLVSAPFSLLEMSTDQEEQVKALIERAAREGKKVFLPVNYDGHWFYLLKEKEGEEDVWSIQDEQPFIDDEAALSIRQKGMLKHSTALLDKLIGKDNYNELLVYSTEDQFNDFDCGTRVINAYRTIADSDYLEHSHADILVELLEKQLSQEEYEALPELLFSEDIELNEKVDQVIEATVATQNSEHEQFENYQTLVKNTVYDVINRQGFFANLQNRIPVQDLEKDLDIDLTDRSAEEIEEIDEEFAAALQEAECIKAGL
ncbi:hypothetical protein [Legionella sp. 29fVS95]|uniref:hypothetical protein n=1 Tax=Legionella sp. 29fVS95 TaxID=3402813 RepID=UPI003AF42E9A